MPGTELSGYSLSKDGNSSLGWFCFDPEKLISRHEFKTVSKVSVEGKDNYTGLNGVKTIQNIEVKKDSSISLNFSQFVFAKFSQEEIGKKPFKNDYKTVPTGLSGVSQQSGSVDEKPTWNPSNSHKGYLYKEVTKTPVTINYSDIKEKRLKVCEGIDIAKKEVKFEGSDVKYEDDTLTPTNSNICVVLSKEEEKLPEPEPDGFCSKIIDSNENFGNNAAFSLIANFNKNGRLPAGDALFQDNDNNSEFGSTGDQFGGLRMTKIYGGNDPIEAGGQNPFLYARPYDSIRFRHVLCYGSLAVTSLSLEEAKGGAKERKYKAPQAEFNIIASPGSDHLFGNTINGGGNISITTNKDSGELNANGLNLGGSVPKYGTVVDSPTDDNDLPCDNDAGVSSEGGFQIPGRDGCGSVNSHDVGKEIKHEMNFKEIQAWVGGPDENTTPGNCACNEYRSYREPSPGSYGSNKDMPHKELKYQLCEEDGSCKCHPYDCNCYPSTVPCSEGTPPGQVCHTQVCQTCWKTCKKYKLGKDYTFSPMHTKEENHIFSVAVKVPFNFILKMAGAPKFPENRPTVIFPGEVLPPLKVATKVKSRVNKATSNDGESYATRTPDGTKVAYVKFLIDADRNYSEFKDYENTTVESSGDAQDVCNHLGADISGECSAQVKEIGALNPESKREGEEQDVELDGLVVPDEDAGKKVCVVAAAYPADSHGEPDQETIPQEDQDSAMNDQVMSNKHWRLSKIACRTIAKKPAFQAWNGGVFAQNITTSTTTKKLGAKLTDNAADPDGVFGSWADHEVIASGSIFGFASGATLGYGRINDSDILSLPGGKTPETDLFSSKLVPMTIANTGNIGNANIARDQDVYTLLRDRYTNLEGGVTLDGSFATPCTQGSTQPGCLKNGAKYVTASSIDSEIIIPKAKPVTENYANNTYIIDATKSGELLINSNICIDGCDNSSLLTQYNNIAEIPQVLIFADSVRFGPNARRVDAWIIASSELDTCSEFQNGTTQSGKQTEYEVDTSISPCSATLTVNGPVILSGSNFRLGRTAGAYPGRGSGEYPSATISGKNRLNNFPTDPRLFLERDGSITPSEIFNLHPASYLWAFNQSQRLTQAVVTHSRELPPRF